MPEGKQLLHRGRTMKVVITYWESGRTWKATVIAKDVPAARSVAQARNPSIRIVAMNPVV